MIETGVRAPDFALPDHSGSERTLGDLRGSGRLVIAFYPADFSPVCGDQFEVYEPCIDEIRGAGADLVGISVDSVWSHGAFRKQLGTSVTLLSDFQPRGEVCEAYGACIAERGHANRSLVLIGEDGRVGWVHESPTPLEIPPVELILDALS